MRARNLKPGLFKNELLGSADPLYTILFEGLWCSADREGRLEDRPLRICAEVFPYRRAITERRMDRMLQWLHDHKFITRYYYGDEPLIQVLEFKKHQNPHSKESQSKIPELRLGKPRARNVPSTGKAPDEEQPFPERARLTPDSGLLTPDSGLRTPYTCTKPDPVQVLVLSEAERHERFERVQAAYPEFAGGVNWILVEKACRQLVDQGATWDDLGASVQRFAAFVTAKGRSGPQFVDSPLKFFTTDMWQRDWKPPPTKAEKRTESNLDAAEQAKRELFGSAQ